MLKILMILLLTGCGSFPATQGPFLDPEIREYYYEFIDEANARGHIIEPIPGIISVDRNLPVDAEGICDAVGLTNALDDALMYKITVRPYDAFAGYEFQDDVHKMVVIHELGHCLLGISHTEESCQIMNPATDYFGPECMPYDWDKLYTDMLGERK